MCDPPPSVHLLRELICNGSGEILHIGKTRGRPFGSHPHLNARPRAQECFEANDSAYLRGQHAHNDADDGKHDGPGDLRVPVFVWAHT